MFYGKINPKREWCIFLILFAICAIVLGYISFSLYENMQPDNISADENGKTFVPEKVNLTNLDNTVLNYEGLSDKFMKLKKIKLVDPSL